MNRERSSGALDLLALGRACVDEILEVEAYPAEDQKRPLTARIREGGGQASTAACLAGHLGGRVAFLGVLGADEGGTFVRARMEAFGVEVASTPQPRGVTPVAFCIVARRSGTRTILYEPSKEAPLGWAELDLTLVERARTVLVDPQAEHVIPFLLPLCRSLGIPLIADAEHARGDDWRQTWGQADVLAASETFLREIGPGLTAEEAIEVASREARGTVLATLGAGGALAALEGKILRVPAPRVEVRDTTGAGDSFHGGLCLALARGFPMVDAIRYAVAAASLACRGLGGRSFPNVGEVESLWPTLTVVG